MLGTNWCRGTKQYSDYLRNLPEFLRNIPDYLCNILDYLRKIMENLRNLLDYLWNIPDYLRNLPDYFGKTLDCFIMGKIFLLISKHWRKCKKLELFTDMSNYMIIMQNTILRILWHMFFLHVMGNGIRAFVGGASPRPPYAAPSEGDSWGGGSPKLKD